MVGVSWAPRRPTVHPGAACNWLVPGDRQPALILNTEGRATGLGFRKRTSFVFTSSSCFYLRDTIRNHTLDFSKGVCSM